MRSILLGIAAGIGILQTQATLQSIWLNVIEMLVAAAVLIALRKQRAAVRIPVFVLGGVVLGFCWASLFAQAYLSHELPAELEGRDLVVTGTIASLPGFSEQGARFDLRIEQALAIDGVVPTLPERVSLSWPAGFQGRAAQAVPDIQPGERWQLTVRLTRPHGNANPQGFDYEVWLLEQNLRATGSVRPDQTSAVKNIRRDQFVFSLANCVERSRAWLRARILAALPGKRYASVLVALVIGDQRGVQQSDWTVFTRTGIGHLISISGLHITMVAGLFALIGRALWRRSFFTQAELPLRLPAQKFAAMVAVTVAYLYVLLAGFGVPAQRTLYMIAVLAVALWSGRSGHE